MSEQLQAALRNSRHAALNFALSIRQPWIELILRGDKREELRSTWTAIRERVYLYAARTPANCEAGKRAWQRLASAHGDFPIGVIVGTVEIVNCYWNARRHSYAYVLNEPQRFDVPLIALNQPGQRFWRPLFTVEEQAAW